MNRIYKLNRRGDTVIKTGLFLLSPFFAFLYSLHNIKSKSSYVVFFLFSVMFGIAFTVSNDYRAEGAIDGTHYRIVFEDIVHNKLNVLNIYSLESEEIKDIYVYVVSYLISRITDNYHILFVVYAILFAFFMLKSLKFLTKEDQFDTSLTSFLLVSIFILSNSIFNINGVRFWTAAWIGVYSIFQIFKNGNKKYFLLAAITPFIHLSYVFFIALLLIGYFTSRFGKMWSILFFFSFVTSNLSYTGLSNISSYLPPIFSNFDSFISVERYNDSFDRGIILSTFRVYIEPAFINLCMFLFIVNRNKIKQSNAYKIFSFLLVYVTFCNFIMPIPELGRRFMALSLPIMAYTWLVTFKNIKYKYIIYSYPLFYCSSLYMLFVVWYPKVTDVWFYISSPFVTIYKYIIAY